MADAPLRLFDSHAHIGSPDLMSEAPGLIERAREAGVDAILAIGAGYGVGPNGMAVSLAEDHRNVWATAGVHPHDADHWSELAQTAIDGWLGHSRVVAVGECGLDYWYENSPRDAQAEALVAQIGLAHETGLPLVIHVRPSRDSRDAFDDILRLFDEHGADRAGGVIHCFTGDLEFAHDALARGFDISFSGILTFKNADALRDVARAVPLERTHVETDAPLLAPVPHRGKRNRPAWVVHVAECLAELHGRPLGDIAAQTFANTARRFSVAPR